MAAIDNLNANLQVLNATVQSAVAKLGQPSGPSEAAVQEAADQVATINTTLAAALNPPTP